MAEKESQDILIFEQKGFQKLIEDIKTITYNVLFVLLKDNQEDEVLGLFFETGADYMQMLNFPFGQKIQHVWKASTFLEIIFTIVYIFSISRYMPRINYDYFVMGIYMLNFVIFLIVLDILYVSWSFSKKKFGMTWPLTILRSVASLLVTVFFLPITETLLSIAQCQSNEIGKQVHSNFPEIECYVGWHLVHTIVSCMFIMIFVIIAGVVALTYFEPKMKTKDRTARQDSKGEVAFITNKVINQAMFSFVPDGNDWIMVIICFALSIQLHWVYNVGDPYYDSEVGLFYKVITTYYLWTNFMLFISQLFLTTTFDGGLIAWIIGLPFIILIMMTTQKSNIETLTQSQVKFHSGEEVQQHLRYVLQLIDQHKNDKNSYMLLVGYVEKHKEICNQEDCSLKAKKKKKLAPGETEMDEVCKLLMKELDRMYQNGLQKFNMCTKLRLSYVFFLIQRFGKTEKAKQQLKKAEQTKPTFQESFIIYRTKEKFQENHNEDEDSDVVKAITFDSYLTQWEEYMNLSAQFHKEFWAELREENPDLSQLNTIGSKISKAGFEVKDLYMKMNKINSKVPGIHQIFGEYLLNVLNDQDTAEKEFQTAKDLQNELKSNDQNSNSSLLAQPFPHAIVSNKKGQVGIIKQVNILFTILFGFQRDQVIGKKLNLIMPEIYGKKHDDLMKKFQQNLVMNQNNYEEISLYFNPNGKNRFGKSQNGYIFPLWYYVTFLNDECTDFIATFKADTNLKEAPKTHIFTDSTGVISDTSSSAIQNFGIQKHNGKKSRKIKLESICQEVWDERESLFAGQTQEITYTISNPSEGDVTFKYQVRANEVKLTTVLKDALDDEDETSDEILGIRFEFEQGQRIEKVGSAQMITLQSNTSINQLLPVPAGGQSSVKGSVQQSDTSSIIENMSLQKRFEAAGTLLNNNEFHQDFVMRSEIQLQKQKQKLDETQWGKFVLNLYNSGDQDSYHGDTDEDNDLNEQDLNQIDFAKGIVTRRLVNNHIESIWENSDDEIDSEDPDTSVFKEQYADQFDNEEDQVLFNQKGSTQMIRNTLSQNHSHQSIKYFQITSYIWITFLMCVSITQYLFCNDKMNNFQKDVEIIQLVNLRVFEFDQMVNRVIDLVSIQRTNYTDNTTIIEGYQNDIKDTVASFIEHAQNIWQPEYDRYTSGFDVDFKVNVKDDGEVFTSKSINYFDSMFYISTIALETASLPIEQISMKNIKVYNLIHNFFNGFDQMLNNLEEHVYQYSKTETESFETELIVLLILLIIFSTISISIFICMLFSIKDQRESVLFLFLDIPAGHVSSLYRRCDKFLQSYVGVQEKFEKENMDEESSDEEDDDADQSFMQKTMNSLDENDNDSLIKRKQNRKKIIKKYRQNQFKGSEGIFLQFIVIAFFTFTFAAFNIWGIFDQKNTINFLFPQYYKDTYLNQKVSTYMSVQKLFLLQPDFQIAGQPASIVAYNLLDSLMGSVGQLRTFNFDLLSKMDSFRSYYHQTLYGNVCELNSGIVKNMDQCTTIIRKNLQTGVLLAIQYYFDVFRDNLNELSLKTPNKEQITKIFQKPDFQDTDYSFYQYTSVFLNQMIFYERDYLVSGVAFMQNIQIIVVIFYLLIMFFFYIFFWQPYISELNLDLNRTISMLNMIPISVIKENGNIRKFIKNLIKETSQS